MQTVMFWMWTKSRGRLPTYLLMGGSGLNVVHACSLFFWEKKKKMSTRHAYQWSDGFEVLDVLPRGLMDLKYVHAFQRFNGFEIWTCFPEVRWFEVSMCFPEIWWIWNLDVLPRGSLKLNLDVLPKGPMVSSLDMLPRGPMVWCLDVLPRGPMDLKFGRAS